MHIIPCLLAVFSASAQGTAFTYQGRLNDGSNTANGSYDLLFKLYPASNSGSPTGGITLTNSATAVSNGLFTTTLDFGSNILNGTSQWLEIGVRSNGTSSFNTLSPRQQLTPAPYAIFAAKAATATAATTLSGVVPGASLSGSYGSAVTFNNSTNMFSGTFTGNGAGLTNLSKTLTNPAFFDAAPKASYVLVTNRTMLLPSNPGQTNGLCLYSIIDPSVSVLSSIGFLDPSGPRFAGINWFPNHTGSEMEMTIDCPGSTAIGWAQETIPGIVLQPNRSLQIGITSGYGRLEAIYIQGVYTSYAAPNMGYSIPLSFNSAYTSNGIGMNQLMTLWAHATNTNGESRLTLYDNWDQAATPDLKSHDFSKSVIRAEFITASNGGSGGVLLNGIVLATNLVVGDGFFSRSLTLMANSNTPTLFDLKMNAMNASTFCVVSNVNAAGTYVVAAFSMEDDSGNHTGLATYGGQPMTLLSHNATYLSGSAYQMLDVFGLPGAIGTANVAYTNNLATAPYAISGGALTIINVASVGASSTYASPSGVFSSGATNTLTTLQNDLVLDIVANGHSPPITGLSGQTKVIEKLNGAKSGLAIFSMNGTGSSMTDVVAATDSLVMLSVAFHPAVIVPTITGNGSGLTNLQAASLVGNIAAANLPGGGGLTTNITTGSYTLYITNGLILRVSGP